MASEDALQEAEALEAIFAEDFVKHSAESFTLTIRPATGADGACHGACSPGVTNALMNCCESRGVAQPQSASASALRTCLDTRRQPLKY